MKVEATATINKETAEKRTAAIDYDMPADLAGITDKFGADAVYNGFIDSAVITLQAGMRRDMVAGVNKEGKEVRAALDDAALQEKYGAYVFDGKQVTKASALERAKGLLGKMSPEDRKALLDSLKQE